MDKQLMIGIAAAAAGLYVLAKWKNTGTPLSFANVANSIAPRAATSVVPRVSDQPTQTAQVQGTVRPTFTIGGSVSGQAQALAKVPEPAWKDQIGTAYAAGHLTQAATLVDISGYTEAEARSDWGLDDAAVARVRGFGINLR